MTEDKMTALWEKRFFLLDMDGTLYLGDRLFEGTHAFLQYIRDIGGRYMFLTNNSSKSVDAYVDKLSGLGITAAKEDFFTSVDATVLDLQQQHFHKIYAFGTRSFRQQLSMAGLPITDTLEEGIDCLCMGFDTELTFGKLEDACRLLKGDIAYIAANPDWVCPTEYGYVPDCGSVSEMLFRATGRRPRFIGKPQPEMLWRAIEKGGFDKQQTVIFGDRLYTDIASGHRAGVTTVFVLSGEGTMADVEQSEVKPDFIFRDIEEFTAAMRRDGKEA